ncbi:MAG: energy transducer TonB [Flavobacteriales bacterium]
MQGVVRIKLTINEKGKIKTIETLTSLTPSTDKAAIKAISSLKNQWIPAIRKSDGQPVEFTFIIPISFRLAE